MNNLEFLALTLMRGLRQRWDEPVPGDWADVLATIPLFAGVSTRRLRELAGAATLAEFAPGETIVFAGDPDDSLYLILAGHARSRGAGRVLGVGEYFGEVAVIDGRPHAATVVAMSYVHLMKLPSRVVREVAREHPAMTFTMLKSLIARFRHLEAQTTRAA